MNARQEWRNAIRDSDSLGTAAKLVALVLDTYMSAAGVAWPSQQALAETCGFDVRTIRNAVGRLERAGFLTVKRGRGRGHVSVYQATLLKADPRYTNPPKSGSKRQKKRILDPLKADARHPRTSKELVINKGTRKKPNGKLEHVQVDQAMLDLAKGWLSK